MLLGALHGVVAAADLLPGLARVHPLVGEAGVVALARADESEVLGPCDVGLVAAVEVGA